jgi:hypothetical protein
VEDCVKEWMQDRSINLYVGLSAILVSNMWWARNNAIFKDKHIPHEVIAGVTLSQAEESKVVLKSKNPKSSLCHLLIMRFF